MKQSIPVQRAEDVFGPEYSRSSAAPSSGFPTIASLTKTANSITSALQDSTSGTNPAARSSVVIQVLYYLAVAVALLDFLYLIGWWYFRTKSADVTVDPLKFWFVLLLGALSPFVVLQAHMMKSQGTTPKRLGDLATVHAIVTTVFLIYVLLVVGVGPLEDGKLDASGAAVASHVSPTPAIVSPAVASPDVPPGVVLAPVVVPPAGPLPALGNDTAANATNPEGPPALGAAGAGEKGDGKAAVADAPASPSPVSPSPATPFPAVVDPAKPHGVKGGVHPDKAAPKTSVKRLLPLWVIALKTLYVIPMWVVVGAGSVQRWMGVRVRKGRSD
ncbi:hypothetical protein HK101_006296 [Irineochytrium annulatum]|nr:hypothetical protein HK101_006296 [Irineochytrium annulatum]